MCNQKKLTKNEKKKNVLDSVDCEKLSPMFMKAIELEVNALNQLNGYLDDDLVELFDSLHKLIKTDETNKKEILPIVRKIVSSVKEKVRCKGRKKWKQKKRKRPG